MLYPREIASEIYPTARLVNRYLDRSIGRRTGLQAGHLVGHQKEEKRKDMLIGEQPPFLEKTKPRARVRVL